METKCKINETRRANLIFHSKYSGGRGVCSIDDYVTKAKEFGMSVIGISDYANTIGFYELERIAKKEKLRAIYGVDLNFYDKFMPTFLDRYTNQHITIIAKNNDGLSNLYQLLAIAYKNNEETPSVSKENVNKYRQNLLIGSGSSFYTEIMNLEDEDELREAINFYDFIQIEPFANYQNIAAHKKISKASIETKLNQIIRISQEENKLVIAMDDSYYINDIQRDAYEYLKMGTLANIEEFSIDSNKKIIEPDLYLKNDTDFNGMFLFLDQKVRQEIIYENMQKLLENIKEISPSDVVNKIPALLQKKSVERDYEKMINNFDVSNDVHQKMREEMKQLTSKEQYELLLLKVISQKCKDDAIGYLIEEPTKNCVTAYISDCLDDYLPSVVNPQKNFNKLSLYLLENNDRDFDACRFMSNIVGENHCFKIYLGIRDLYEKKHQMLEEKFSGDKSRINQINCIINNSSPYEISSTNCLMAIADEEIDKYVGVAKVNNQKIILAPFEIISQIVSFINLNKLTKENDLINRNNNIGKYKDIYKPKSFKDCIYVVGLAFMGMDDELRVKIDSNYQLPFSTREDLANYIINKGNEKKIAIKIVSFIGNNYFKSNVEKEDELKMIELTNCAEELNYYHQHIHHIPSESNIYLRAKILYQIVKNI